MFNHYNYFFNFILVLKVSILNNNKIRPKHPKQAHARGGKKSFSKI